MTKQVQKGGDRSTNVQAKEVTIIQGLDYEQTRQIALDVFRANFVALSGEASEIARKRAEEITEEFLNNLKEENPEGFKCAQDPDFQHSLYTVQKEYARTGDKELGDILVDLLVDRSKHEKRSIIQIVLNESLAVAPKLTADQMAALSIVFIIKYTINHGINNLATLKEYLDTYLKPFVLLLSKNASCYQHLEYAGCGSISISSANLGETLRRKYQGVFSKGFEVEEIEKRQIQIGIESPIFTRCLHEPQKFQINAMTEDIIRHEAQKLNISEEDTNKLISLNNNCLMQENEIKTYLEEVAPYMDEIFGVWENSHLKNFTLTSVGIAIGHANVKKSLGEFTDLSIWIN